MDFVKKIAASDVTDEDINRLQVSALYSRGSLKRTERLEISRTLGVLRSILGDGSVSCHCGGDLCVCDNYGERDCPVCFGEGDVSHERSAQYLKAESEAMAAIRAAWPTPSDKEGGE